MLTLEQKQAVVDELVGGFEPIADSSYDSKALKRQEDAEEILYSLLAEFMEVSRGRNSVFGSVQTAGDKALKFLIGLRRDIDDVIDCAMDEEVD